MKISQSEGLDPLAIREESLAETGRDDGPPEADLSLDLEDVSVTGGGGLVNAVQTWKRRLCRSNIHASTSEEAWEV